MITCLVELSESRNESNGALFDPLVRVRELTKVDYQYAILMAGDSKLDSQDNKVLHRGVQGNRQGR
jgi:hypothetical protein